MGMNKIFWMIVSCLFFSTATVGQVVWGQNNSRTDYRDNAGLRGDAGAISGFFQAGAPVNYPTGATGWWHLLDVRHDNPTNNYSLQMAGSFFDQNLWFRKTNNNPTQIWSKLLALQNQNLGTTAGDDIEMIKLENLSGGNNSYLSFSLNRFANGTDWNTTSTRIQSGTDWTRQGYIEFNPYNAPEGIAFGGRTAEYMRIMQNGNVGIGNIMPASKLWVTGSRITVYQIGEARYHLYNGGAVAEWLLGQKSNTANNFTISKSVAGMESDYFSIAPGGNIGIGNTTPQFKFDIASVENENGRLRLANTSSTGSNAAGSFPAIEVLGARGDANPTFEGRLALGTRRTDGNNLSNQTVGAVLFGGQYGTDNTFQQNKILYSSSIQGIAEGNFSSATAMPTGIAFFTGTVGDDLGSPNLYYGIERMRISSNGNIGIGTTAPGPYKLAVEGTIATRKIKVTQVNPWADYVFETGYKLPRLTEVEQFILKYKHLPDVPSAADAEKNGIDLGDNQTLLLKKVEELTLYMIELNKQMQTLAKENEKLNKKVEALAKENEGLKKVNDPNQ